MTALTADDVRGTILERVASRRGSATAPDMELTDDLDLFESGLLDSFGLLELIGDLEQHYGVTLAFDDVGVDELTRLGSFCDYVVSAPRRADAERVEAVSPSSESLPAPADGPITRPSPPGSVSAGRFGRKVGTGSAALHRLLVRARDKAFSLSIRGSFASFGVRTVIQMPVRLSGTGAMAVGSDVFIGSGSWLQVLGDPVQTVIEIGDGTAMAGYCVLSAESGIRIGRNVSFARGVYVSDVAHEYADVARSVLESGTTVARPVEVGDGAWLGENVTVLPGVRIGTRAVVSANSVVSSDVPDYTLVAGVPARIVRHFRPELRSVDELHDR